MQDVRLVVLRRCWPGKWSLEVLVTEDRHFSSGRHTFFTQRSWTGRPSAAETRVRPLHRTFATDHVRIRVLHVLVDKIRHRRRTFLRFPNRLGFEMFEVKGKQTLLLRSLLLLAKDRTRRLQRAGDVLRRHPPANGQEVRLQHLIKDEKGPCQVVSNQS